MTTRSATDWLATLALVGAVVACGEDAPTQSPSAPGEPSEPTTVGSDMSVSLLVDDTDAEPGDTVLVAAEVREGADATPTGFVASLGYDAGSLAPAGQPAVEGDGMRVVNLEAGDGEVRAAGAAADGFSTPTLFAVEMEVRGDGYVEGLDLRMEELDVVENGFADVASRLPPVTGALEGGAAVEPGPPAVGDGPGDGAVGGGDRLDMPEGGDGARVPDLPERDRPGGG